MHKTSSDNSGAGARSVPVKVAAAASRATLTSHRLNVEGVRGGGGAGVGSAEAEGRSLDDKSSDNKERQMFKGVSAARVSLWERKVGWRASSVAAGNVK